MWQRGNLILRAGFASDVGGRFNNEDAYLVNEPAGLFIVADGMGGHEKGEVASRFASENLAGIIASARAGSKDWTLDDSAPDIPFSDEASLLKYAILLTNRWLYLENENTAALLATKRGGANAKLKALAAHRKRMGTTLVSILIHGGYVFITNVGDSRAYRIAGGKVTRLTRDHTWVAEQVAKGELTPAEAARHEKRNVILRSVGFKETVAADIEADPLDPPERFLLCSDGLSNAVAEGDILDLATMADIQEACRRLVALAIENGGKDNITVVLVDVARRTESDEVQRDITDQ